MPPASQARPIAVLSAAAFISAATMRVADPLLPQVAREYAVSVGAAASIVTGFAVAYGLFQLVHGPLGDRYGKYRWAAAMTLLSAVGVGAAAASDSLMGLVALRIAAGATAAAIIPLSMAWIGDVVPYERRQATIARFLSGQILGSIFGQSAGGVFGEFLSWRWVFLLLALIYVAVAALMAFELRSGRVADHGEAMATNPGAIARRYLELVRRPRVRLICGVVAIEGALFFGGTAFFAAWLREAYRLDYVSIGALVGCFGLGGFVYVAVAKHVLARIGERGMALAGGIVLAVTFAAVPFAPPPLVFAGVMAVCGIGFYLIHNTLQTNATQMAPEARGSAVALFASTFFLGQAIGVAFCGAAIDRIGYPPVFAACGLGLLAVGIALSLALARNDPQRGRSGVRPRCG